MRYIFLCRFHILHISYPPGSCPTRVVVTPLLVPAQRVAYNRAAGASLRERDLRSYVLGAYRSERGDEGGSARPVALREEGRTPRLLAKQGTADFNLAVAWGCPLAVYGPGDSRLDHTAEERLDLREYRGALKVLDRALRTLMTSL